MSRSMPRFVAKRFDVPAGQTASGICVFPSALTQRRTSPSPPPGDYQLGALLEGPLDRPRRPLALRYLEPERRRDARVGERAPQLGEPAAERLAGMCDDRQLHERERLSAAALAARQANSSSRIAPMPTSTPPTTSSGWCMPRYMRDNATNVVSRIAQVQASAFLTLPVMLGCEQQHKAGVDGNRGGGVARGVAGIDRQILEAVDRWTVTWDHDRGEVVGGRFGKQDEDRECRQEPAAGEGAVAGDDADDDRQDRGLADLRGDLGNRGQRAAALVDELLNEALILAGQAEPASAGQDVHDQQAEQDRGDQQQEEAAEQRDEEDERRMARTQRVGEPLCGSTGAGGEHRACPRVAVSLAALKLRATADRRTCR